MTLSYDYTLTFMRHRAVTFDVVRSPTLRSIEKPLKKKGGGANAHTHLVMRPRLSRIIGESRININATPKCAAEIEGKRSMKFSDRAPQQRRGGELHSALLSSPKHDCGDFSLSLSLSLSES